MLVPNYMNFVNIQQKQTAPVYVNPAQSQSVQQAPVQSFAIPAYKPVISQAAEQYNKQIASVNSVLDRFPVLKERLMPVTVNRVQQVPTEHVEWKNDLRSLFRKNEAVIYAMIPRTFNAKDTDGNGLIENGEKSGTWLSDIEGLDDLKKLGINTLHVLPVHPPGKIGAMGTAGSVYAPEDLLKIDPQLDDPNDPRSVKEEMKQFTAECHKRGIRVMLDLPSCGSVDLYNKRPDLMAIDSQGRPEVPQGWQDIRMFGTWADKDKRILNPALVDYHKKYIDMCIDLGVDGIRADVARAKPVEFWDIIIPYARSKDPQFAFLAEAYTYEDASPMLNMPYDRPEDNLKAGFDSYYGQYHIFHSWKTAKDIHNYVKENLEMSHRHEAGKSLIGSFATHDDRSPMSNGGVPYCNLTTGLQATLPMLNPYVVTGFESGDRYIYPYKDKHSAYSATDSHEHIVHSEMVDIFNLSRKPGGEHPEIGDYMSKMMKFRKEHEDVITKGSYIPLEVEGNKEDKIIAYARHLNGKTLLIIANKDVNARETGKVKIPGLKQTQVLKDLSPSYGIESRYTPDEGFVKVDLGPARFHVFEIDTPNIEKMTKEVYRQNI